MVGVERVATIRSIVVFISTTNRCQAYLLAPQLDFKLISRLEVENCGVSLADQQVAVALHSGHRAEFAATLADTTNATNTKTDAFGLQQCFIKSGEVQAIATIFLVGDIATCADEIRLADITQIFDFIEKVAPSEHRFRKKSTFTT